MVKDSRVNQVLFKILSEYQNLSTLSKICQLRNVFAFKGGKKRLKGESVAGIFYVPFFELFVLFWVIFLIT